jgi:hypothetical protein
MEGLSTYDSTKESLAGILKEIDQGKIQLPEFQRDWIWDDDHVSSLLASVTLSYPIGAVMLLQAGNEEFIFKTRLIHGVDKNIFCKPDLLVLDGQQRLTALFQALYSPCPVETRDLYGKEIRRHYHVVIDEVISDFGDREEVILSLSEDRMRKNFRGEVIEDYSTFDQQCQAGILPLDIVFNSDKLMEWMMQYLNIIPEEMQSRLKKWKILTERIITPISQYQVPIIVLKKGITREAICQVFEKVNTGGVPLTIFELLTATFAAEGYNLRDDWTRRKNDLLKYPIFKGLQSEDFLQIISLLSTRNKKIKALETGIREDQSPGISCKRREILRMKLDDYKTWADISKQALVDSAKLLHQLNFFTNRDLPYGKQIVPLAAIIATLGDSSKLDNVKSKLSRWFWCGVFGELYGSAIESRFAKDLPEVLEWIRSGSIIPSTISDANFAASRLYSLRTRNSAAYKGIYALLMKSGCIDFRSGDPINVATYFDERIDIHHIFPQKWCQDHFLPREEYDCILNKTALSARTNRIVGGKAPSEYIEIIQRAADINEERMNEILNSHLITPTLIRKNDFNNFIKLRQETIISLIESVIGKPVVRDIRDVSPDIGENIEENLLFQEELEEEENDEINNNNLQDNIKENFKNNF